MNALLIDDDPVTLGYLSQVLSRHHTVAAFTDGKDALAMLKPEAFDIVFTDLRMPPPDGFEVLRAARTLDPPVPVIVLTALDTARAAVDALRLGASDFLVKPARPEEIERAMSHARPAGAGCCPGHDPTSPAGSEYGLIGDSAPMQLVRRLIPTLSQSRDSVLILGETGTGKELLARALHASGPRQGAPFIAHNMAATPADLAESLFFGHTRGAFSGATSDHPGLFEQADGGTLFLDEVDSFPGPLQAKLLRVLEGGCVQRVGSVAARPLDVRVIAASSTELGHQVSAGAFRADLYYRLRQLEVMLPPLRDRRCDIPILVRHFLGELADSAPAARLETATMDRLLGYHWPGNVRELRSVVRSAVVLAGGGPIRVEHLQRALETDGPSMRQGCSDSLHAVEMRHILETLERLGGNQSLAARILGIDRGTLARKLGAATQRRPAGPSAKRRIE